MFTLYVYSLFLQIDVYTGLLWPLLCWEASEASEASEPGRLFGIAYGCSAQQWQFACNKDCTAICRLQAPGCFPSGAHLYMYLHAHLQSSLGRNISSDQPADA